MRFRRVLCLLTLVVPAVLMPTVTAGAWSPGEGQHPSFATLTMTSDPGDWAGSGQTYSFSTAAGDNFGDGASADRNLFHVGVLPAGSWEMWDLSFTAPQGQPLVVGSYPDVHRYLAPLPGPGLSVAGNHGCNDVTGSFTVLEAYWVNDLYPQRFHATFEQHCEGAEPALRGEILVVNPPAPPALAIGVTLDPVSSASKKASGFTLTGTVSCSVPTLIRLTVSLTQRDGATSSSTGGQTASLACIGEAGGQPWAVTIPYDQDAGLRYDRSEVLAAVTGTATDPLYRVDQQASVQQVVDLIQ